LGCSVTTEKSLRFSGYGKKEKRAAFVLTSGRSGKLANCIRKIIRILNLAPVPLGYGEDLYCFEKGFSAMVRA
jgi:hypothetical protein